MKKYIVISLLSLLSMNVGACIFERTHNYYVFQSYESSENEWKSQIDKQTLDNWRCYLGAEYQNYDYGDVSDLLKTVNKVAVKRGDKPMQTYVKYLKDYLWCANLYKGWNYPTKAEIKLRKVLLTTMNLATGKLTKSRLRSQFDLLHMRCSMLLGLHEQNIVFWQKTASLLQNSIYKTMMSDIYAGALANTGQREKAAEIFAELKDWESIGWRYNKERNFQGIKSVYEQNPNSPALTFLIQDFVNNAQETFDYQQLKQSRDSEIYVPGKLNFNFVYERDCRQFIQFAQRIAKEGKSKSPALWQSAASWIAYLCGDKQEAYRLSDASLLMEGTEQQKVNASVIHIFIRTAVENLDNKYDDKLVDELKFLNEKMSKSSEAESFHYCNLIDRLVYQVLYERYKQAGRLNVATALIGYEDAARFIDGKNSDSTDSSNSFSLIKQNISRIGESVWNRDYNTDLFVELDTIPVEQVVSFAEYLNKKSGNALDRYLCEHIYQNDIYFKDIIGTRLIRAGRFAEAENYLKQIPLTFIQNQNIAIYMAHRSFDIEPWMKFQVVSEEAGKREMLKSNQKLDFVKKVNQLEAQLAVVNAVTAQQLSYQLATLYAQASLKGNCWYLDHYGVYNSDKLQSGDFDFCKQAITLLHVTAESEDFSTKEKALYALAWVPDSPWGRVNEWIDSKGDYEIVDYTNSRRHRAYATLNAFAIQNAGKISTYISNCDELKAFREGKIRDEYSY